jgi:hypothetical protein
LPSTGMSMEFRRPEEAGGMVFGGGGGCAKGEKGAGDDGELLEAATAGADLHGISRCWNNKENTINDMNRMRPKPEFRPTTTHSLHFHFGASKLHRNLRIFGAPFLSWNNIGQTERKKAEE